MKSLANFIWHIPFLGFITAFWTFGIGCLLIITIIGSPLGFGLIEYSKFLLFPFSRELKNKSELNIKENKLWKGYGFIITLLYLPFGIVISAITIAQICGLIITIFGIPYAIILIKSLPVFFNPVGKKCVNKL